MPLSCVGAGIGIDSGLPDFRGENGFWRAYPTGTAGISFVEIVLKLSSAPRLAWGFYGHRLQLYRSITPMQVSRVFTIGR